MKAIVTCKIIFATLVSGHDLFETSALLLSLYVALFKLITNCSVILVAQKLLLWAKFYFFTQWKLLWKLVTQCEFFHK